MCAVMQIYPTMLNLLIKIYSFHPLKGHQRTQVCTVICYLKFSQVAIRRFVFNLDNFNVLEELNDA